MVRADNQHLTIADPEALAFSVQVVVTQLSYPLAGANRS